MKKIRKDKIESSWQKGSLGRMIREELSAGMTFFFNFFFNIFIYFWDRERQSMNGREAEREGDTESEAGSRLHAVSTETNVRL